MCLRRMVLILPIMLLSSVFVAMGQDEIEPQPEISILSPSSGQAIRGSVPIQVDTMTQGFLSAELSFGYQNDNTRTWFLIAQNSEATPDGVMIEWDTTTLTDGTYNLRLVVLLTNGEQYTSDVPALRVRNYSPIETDTPTPSPTLAPQATPSPSITPSPTPTQIPPTPTPLPPNPLQVTQQDIWTNLLRGAAGGLAVIVLAGLYISARKLFRK
jgi:hypothetical protein